MLREYYIPKTGIAKDVPVGGWATCKEVVQSD